MSTTAVLQDSGELSDEQRAYVAGILADVRMDPASKADLVCPRKRRTTDERSAERSKHKQHLECKGKANKSQRRRRQEARPLTHLERIRLNKGVLPHNLDSKKLSPRQRAKVEAILAARNSSLEPTPVDFTPITPDEAPHVPIGKLCSGLELQGVRVVTQVIDGITVFFVDQIVIIPAD